MSGHKSEVELRKARTWCRPRGGPVRWSLVLTDRRRNVLRRSLGRESAMLPPLLLQGLERPRGLQVEGKRPAFRIAAPGPAQARGRPHRVGYRRQRAPSVEQPRNLPRPAARHVALRAVLAGRRGWMEERVYHIRLAWSRVT